MKLLKQPALGFNARMFFLGMLLAGMPALAQSWELLIPQPLLNVGSLGVPSNDPNRLYITDERNGAWDTPDAGMTDIRWHYVGGYTYAEVHMMRFLAVPISGTANDQLYVLGINGAVDQGVYNRSNGTTVWQLQGCPLPGCPFVAGVSNQLWMALAIDSTPLSHEKLMVGGVIRSTGMVNQGVIYSSIDAGKNWTSANGVPPNMAVTDLEYVTATTA